MALNAKEAGSNRAPIAPMEIGTYPARLQSVIELGLQNQAPYKGVEKPPIEKILLIWEFVDEMVEIDGEEKPRHLVEEMAFHNLTAENAKSTKRYNAVDPTGAADGDWTKLLGAPVNVTVVQNAGSGQNKGKVYNNIDNVSVMRQKEADKLPALVNAPRVFTIDSPDLPTFLSFPKFVQDKIKANLRYEGSDLQKLLKDSGNDKPAEKAQASPPKKTVAEDLDDENPF